MTHFRPNYSFWRLGFEFQKDCTLQLKYVSGGERGTGEDSDRVPVLFHPPAKALTLYPLQLPHSRHSMFLHPHSHFPPGCSAGSPVRQVPAPERLTPGSFLSCCRVQQESGAGIPILWAGTCRRSLDNSELDPWATFLSDALCLGKGAGHYAPRKKP